MGSHTRAAGRPWLLWLSFACACTPGGCPPGNTDAGMDAAMPDGGEDAGVGMDAAVDSGADAAIDSGGDGAVDSGADSGLDAGFDAATDSGADAASDASLDASSDAAACDPATCTASGECVTAACVGAACAETPRDDGSDCGEAPGGVFTHLCVAGACVPRGCGDGFREPGPTPAPEACDDGNSSDLDACSTACAPLILDLDVPPDGSYEAALATGAVSMAQSGSGPLLFVWLRDRFDHAEVVARRSSREGVPRPLATDPLVLDSAASAFDAAPSVAALPGAAGWVVVWVARRSDHSGSGGAALDRVLYRMVSRAGILGPERVADEEPSNQAAEPRVASLSSGFVIAWTATRATATDPNGGVRARVFDAAGNATGPSFLPASDVSEREDSPALASSGDDWLLLYASAALTPGATSSLWARRFHAELALDAGSLPVDTGGAHAPSATALSRTPAGARYALAYVRTDEVYVSELAADAAAIDPPHALMPSSLDARAAPSLARYGGGTLVGFEQGFPSRLNVLPETTTLPPEVAILRADWSGSAEGPVSTLRTAAGTWLVWTGSEGPLRTRAVRAFRMPLQ